MPTKIESNCYICGRPSISAEHVPPRCFFPKGSRNSLITVPSCDVHNQEKSHTDEYVRMVLLKLIEEDDSNTLKKLLDTQERSYNRALEIFFKKITDALDNTENHEIRLIVKELLKIIANDNANIKDNLNAVFEIEKILDIKSGIFRASFKNPETAIWLDGQPTISTEVDIARIMSFFELLSMGLCYNYTKQQHKKPKYIVPHFLLKSDISEVEKELSKVYRDNFDKSQSHGENKTVFYYEFFKYKTPIEEQFVLNMCFFDKLIVSAVFDEF